MDLSGSELLIVLLVIVVLFGSTRLPKLARSLGEAQREFRRGVSHAHDDDHDTTRQPNAVAATALPTTAVPATVLPAAAVPATATPAAPAEPPAPVNVEPAPATTVPTDEMPHA